MDSETFDDYWLICPYCAHQHHGPEIAGNDETWDFDWRCDGCNRPFRGSVAVSVTYSAQPLTEEEERRYDGR